MALFSNALLMRAREKHSLVAHFIKETGLPASQVELVEAREGNKLVWYVREKEKAAPVSGKAASNGS